MYFGLALWWRQQLPICCILLWLNLVLAPGFITLRFELIVIHFYVQKFGIKYSYHNMSVRLNSYFLLLYEKSVHNSVSIIHFPSGSSSSCSNIKKESAVRFSFTICILSRLLGCLLFFCNKALSPYNNIPFHFLLLLIAAKAFFFSLFLEMATQNENAFHTLNFSFWCTS